MSLAARATDIPVRITTSPWAGHEHSRGYAVMELPFSSGHLLGLRVWPQTDFRPWVSVWHRTPDGEWEMYNDGALLEATCPRYWGPELSRAELADIDVTWTGPTDLRVEMAEPRLEWTMSMRESRLLRVLNAVSRSLPLWTWRHRPLLRPREWIAKHLLGMGDIQLSVRTASGHEGTIMPEEIYFIDESEAVFDGESLGDPVRLETNPYIGEVPTPTRPVFVMGQAHLGTRDPEEYRQMRERLGDEAPDSSFDVSLAGSMADAADTRGDRAGGVDPGAE